MFVNNLIVSCFTQEFNKGQMSEMFDSLGFKSLAAVCFLQCLLFYPVCFYAEDPSSSASPAEA